MAPIIDSSSFGHVVVNDTLYVVGGHLQTYHDYQKSHFSDRCCAISISSGSVAELPRYPFVVQGHRLLEYNGAIYSFGGFRYEAALDYTGTVKDAFNWWARSSDEVYRLSSGASEWKKVAELPRRRSSYVAARVGAKGFLIGGWDGTPQAPLDHSGRFHSTIEVFDFASETFIPQQVGMGTTPRRAFTACVVGSQIVVAGGGTPYSGEGGICTVEAFETSTLSWTPLPSLGVALFSPGICALNDGSLFLYGGFEFKPPHTRTLHRTVRKLAPGSCAWEDYSVLPENCAAMFPELCPLDSRRILIFGGHGYPDPLGLWHVLAV